MNVPACCSIHCFCCLSVRAPWGVCGVWQEQQRLHQSQRPGGVYEDHGIHAYRNGAHWTEPADLWVSIQDVKMWDRNTASQRKWARTAQNRDWWDICVLQVEAKWTLRILWSWWDQSCWQRQLTWSASKSWEMHSERSGRRRVLACSRARLHLTLQLMVFLPRFVMCCLFLSVRPVRLQWRRPDQSDRTKGGYEEADGWTSDQQRDQRDPPRRGPQRRRSGELWGWENLYVRWRGHFIILLCFYFFYSSCFFPFSQSLWEWCLVDEQMSSNRAERRHATAPTAH